MWLAGNLLTKSYLSWKLWIILALITYNYIQIIMVVMILIKDNVRNNEISWYKILTEIETVVLLQLTESTNPLDHGNK